MNVKFILFPATLLAGALPLAAGEDQLLPGGWKVQDPARPLPVVIAPGVDDNSPPGDAAIAGSS